ncbi:Translation initiation factor 3 subunit J component [Coemansia biformis]|uniref:Eukaryotic translation initiation factor 3 30 kDa subunit n=1 Tax=Coemansia biformis TaxID=1286918 RepID=A0A9W7YDT5_9FUNG|nr:Translation initiation factor 3 subunit J component [Coemansia biformis]
MSDWEGSDTEKAPAVPAVALGARGKWDDEDEDSQSSVAEWDEMSSSDDEGGKSAKAAAESQPKKKSASERIAERQAEREAKREEAMKAAAEYSEEDEDGFMSQKIRERQKQVESDLLAAEDLFSGLTIKDAQVQESLMTINPKTQEEFDTFQMALVERIQKTQSHRLYTAFLEKLIHELAQPLKDAEVRRLSSSLAALASEKQRAAKEGVKGKKKGKKAHLGGLPAKSQVDTTDYTRGYDDFDDFM